MNGLHGRSLPLKDEISVPEVVFAWPTQPLGKAATVLGGHYSLWQL
jgi:hypothetical protein